jgi:hypothetical protein
VKKLQCEVTIDRCSMFVGHVAISGEGQGAEYTELQQLQIVTPPATLAQQYKLRLCLADA